jgi:hypothetical protein
VHAIAQVGLELGEIAERFVFARGKNQRFGHREMPGFIHRVDREHLLGTTRHVWPRGPLTGIVQRHESRGGEPHEEPGALVLEPPRVRITERRNKAIEQHAIARRIPHDARGCKRQGRRRLSECDARFAERCEEDPEFAARRGHVVVIQQRRHRAPIDPALASQRHAKQEREPYRAARGRQHGAVRERDTRRAHDAKDQRRRGWGEFVGLPNASRHQTSRE